MLNAVQALGSLRGRSRGAIQASGADDPLEACHGKSALAHTAQGGDPDLKIIAPGREPASLFV